MCVVRMTIISYLVCTLPRFPNHSVELRFSLLHIHNLWATDFISDVGDETVLRSEVRFSKWLGATLFGCIIRHCSWFQQLCFVERHYGNVSALMKFIYLFIFLKIVHEDLYDEVLRRLIKSFNQVMERMGDPLDREWHLPLIIERVHIWSLELLSWPFLVCSWWNASHV